MVDDIKAFLIQMNADLDGGVATRKELRDALQAALQAAWESEWKAKATRVAIELALAELDKGPTS